MPTVQQVIERLFPRGTNHGQKGRSVRTLPKWPPDAFAATAVLIDRGGCYAYPAFTHPNGNGPTANHQAYLKRVETLARAWKNQRFRDLQALWNKILDGAKQNEVTQHQGGCHTWCGAAYELMMIADEVCNGVGFGRRATGENGVEAPAGGPVDPGAEAPNNNDVISQTYMLMHLLSAQGDYFQDLHEPALSLCQQVPPSEVCVQPKAATARVGCTLRSLTHNLALVPSIGEVRTSWLPSFDATQVKRHDRPLLNLLLVPFPYRIDGRCFRPKGFAIGGQEQPAPTKFFEVDQNWLNDHEGEPLDAKTISDFLVGLITAARREVDIVDGIVLPELALTSDLARAVALELLGDPRAEGLDLFISGVSVAAGADEHSLPRNAVFGCNFAPEEKKLISWDQFKHHRWKLDRGQIANYHLRDWLESDSVYWEHIDISDRQCTFRLIRRGACLTTLICEDLARIDPVQTVIRAIGPNLVIALLMDGPQNQRRWAYRYATVLADDPGSSVLILTSLGLVRRMGSPDRGWYQVGLWKASGGQVKELELPPGHHALLVSLETKRETVHTLDGRSDGNWTVRFDLTRALPIRHPTPDPWAQVD